MDQGRCRDHCVLPCFISTLQEVYTESMNDDEYEDFPEEEDLFLTNMLQEQGLDPNNPDDYEALQQIARNAYLIHNFADDFQKEQELSEEEIKEYIDNLDLYLNYYAAEKFLLAEDAMDYSLLDSFMQKWFPWNADWCSKEAIRSMCISISQFYAWMCRNDMINDADLYELTDIMNENIHEWMELFEDRQNSSTSKMN